MDAAITAMIMFGATAFGIGLVCYMLSWLGKHTADDDKQD